eukprot:865680-Pyramimonas_sp.AAC.1
MADWLPPDAPVRRRKAPREHETLPASPLEVNAGTAQVAIVLEGAGVEAAGALAAGRQVDPARCTPRSEGPLCFC